MSELPGLDLAKLQDWFAQYLRDEGTDAGPLSASLIAGGRSNLTYVVTDGAQEWIVRRPPLGHVLATAHDMGREYRVITALRDTDVPVPRTLGLHEDDDVLGAPFYVMERVHGTPYRRASELEALGTDRTRAISERLVDVLATLHAVDPREVGLGDFGRPEGYLQRQVHRWKKQLDASHSRDLPLADELYAKLAADIPAESGVSIVHGDFRLDNLLVDAADRPAALLDWEMSTLGDPLSDLALMLVYHRLSTVIGGEMVTDVSLAPGFLTEEEVVARYAAASGQDLTRFGFHLGLATFKLAAILEGIHYRFIHGQTVGEGFDQFGAAIHPMLESGLRALEEN